MPGRVRWDLALRFVEICSRRRSRSFLDSASRSLRALSAYSGPTRPRRLIRIANLCNYGTMTPTLGADLLAVVARINRLATQRSRLPLPYAQARLLSTIEDQGVARISDLATLD